MPCTGTPRRDSGGPIRPVPMGRELQRSAVPGQLGEQADRRIDSFRLEHETVRIVITRREPFPEVHLRILHRPRT